MAIDVRAGPYKPAAAQKFAGAFIEGYLSPAFGARSKSELDLLVFTCLIEAKAIDPAEPIYDIARALNIPPARVRAFLLNWQLRTTKAGEELCQSIVDALTSPRNWSRQMSFFAGV
jgi:hypothetical protein